MIGSQSCIVKNISSSHIECYYKRSGGQAVTAVSVSILVDGLGYAASESQLSTKPLVQTGYEVSVMTYLIETSHNASDSSYCLGVLCVAWIRQYLRWNLCDNHRLRI